MEMMKRSQERQNNFSKLRKGGKDYLEVKLQQKLETKTYIKRETRETY